MIVIKHLHARVDSALHCTEERSELTPALKSLLLLRQPQRYKRSNAESSGEASRRDELATRFAKGDKVHW